MSIRQILVIDDDAAVRSAYKLALEGVDYEILLAEDGQQGLEFAEAYRPDLVFLDLKMAGMDGIETLRKLKAMYPNINVYIVTSFQQDYFDLLKQMRDEGFTFELAIKPLNSDQIRMIARTGMH